MSGQLHASTAFTRENPRYPFDRRLSGPQPVLDTLEIEPKKVGLRRPTTSGIYVQVYFYRPFNCVGLCSWILRSVNSGIYDRPPFHYKPRCLSTMPRLKAAWPRNRGLIPDILKKYLHNAQRPHRLWDPTTPSIQWVYPQWQSDRRVKLTAHLLVVPNLWIYEAIHTSSWYGT